MRTREQIVAYAPELAPVVDAIEGSGGTIDLSSESQDGATFKCTIGARVFYLEVPSAE